MENKEKDNLVKVNFSRDTEPSEKGEGSVVGFPKKISRKIVVVNRDGSKTYYLDKDKEKTGKILPFRKKELIGV